jgi:GNAT superfamily N-acetyltransferase
LPRFYSTQTAFQVSVPALLSTYRNTSFTLQDGLSEWKGSGGLLFLHQDASVLGLLQMKRSRTFWELSSFFVDPKEQAKGYGKQLLRYALENADAPVCLRVKQENPAQLLYSSMGFKTEELSDQRYYMKYLK